MYIIIIVAIGISGYIDYQRWLNPLGLRSETDPKQHDGSQEFQVTVPFESSITRDDGTPVYIPETDQQIFDNLDNKEDYPGNISVDQ